MMQKLWAALLFTDKLLYTYLLCYLIYFLYLVFNTKQFIVEHSVNFITEDLFSVFLGDIFYVPIFTLMILLFYSRVIFGCHNTSVFIRQKSKEKIWLNDCIGCIYITLILLIFVVLTVAISMCAVKPVFSNSTLLVNMFVKFIIVVFLYILFLTYLFAFIKFMSDSRFFAFIFTLFIWYFDFSILKKPLFVGKLSVGIKSQYDNLLIIFIYIFSILFIITILGFVHSRKKEFSNENNG